MSAVEGAAAAAVEVIKPSLLEHLVDQDAEDEAWNIANSLDAAGLLATARTVAARLTTVEAERDLLRRQHQGQADHITALRTRVAQVDARLAAVEALTEEPEMALDSIQIRHRYVDIRAALAAPTDKETP